MRSIKSFKLSVLASALSLFLGNSFSPAMADEIVVDQTTETHGGDLSNSYFTVTNQGNLTLASDSVVGKSFFGDSIFAFNSTVNVEGGAVISGYSYLFTNSIGNYGIGSTKQAKSDYFLIYNSVAHFDNILITPSQNYDPGVVLASNQASASFTANTHIVAGDQGTGIEMYDGSSATLDGTTIDSGLTGMSLSSSNGSITQPLTTANLNNTKLTAAGNGVIVNQLSNLNVSGGNILSQGTHPDSFVPEIDNAGIIVNNYPLDQDGEGEGKGVDRRMIKYSSAAPKDADLGPLINLSNHANVQAIGPNSAGIASLTEIGDVLLTTNINVQDTQVSGGKYGIFIGYDPFSFNFSGLTKLSLTNSLVSGVSSEALYVGENANAIINIGPNTSLKAGNGIVLSTKLNSASTVTVQGTTIVGDLQNTGGTTNVTLADNTLWQGAMQEVTNLDVQAGNTWQVTAPSTVSEQLTNSGTVSLSNGNTTGNTLTVNGNYIGNKGNLVLNTVLGGDGSASDMLIVNGDTSGTTKVLVKKTGGSGAKTIDGIKIISVQGNSAGEFTQAGRVVAGAYDYRLGRGLNQNNLTRAPNSSVKDWYLTNLDANSGQMLTRPEAGSYIANLAAANAMFVTRLHERLGETRYLDFFTGKEKVTSLWLRQVGTYSDFHDSTDQLNTQQDTNVTQLGGDVARWTSNGVNRWHLGLMGAYGNSHNRTTSSVSQFESKGSVDGYSVGLYGTWQANEVEKTGPYVDTWMQYSWFKNHINGDLIASEHYRSKGVTASVEGGWTFKLGESGDPSYPTRYFIEPSAQLTWMDIEASEHQEDNGTVVNNQSDGNLQTRLGVRAVMQVPAKSDEYKNRRFQPFLEMNWIHNTKKFAATFNDVKIEQAGTDDLGEIKLGLEAGVSKSTQIWGNIAQQFGTHNYHSTIAILGLKHSF